MPNKNFFVVDKNTGDILRTGNAPQRMIKIQAVNENEIALEGTANDLLEYYDFKEKIVKEIPGRKEGLEKLAEQQKIKAVQYAKKLEQINSEVRKIKEGSSALTLEEQVKFLASALVPIED